MTKTTYDTPIRDQQKATSRVRIIQALVEVVREAGIHGFTVQQVATRAKVSHRTVYRHFPTRQALLDALSEGTNDAMNQAYPERFVPDTPEELPAFVGALFERFEAEKALVIAANAAAMADGLVPTDRSQRTARFREVLPNAFTHLDPARTQAAAVLIRNLMSSRTWVAITQEDGLTNEAATNAVQWAVATLLADLRRRDSAAQATATT